jgi:hypothetical protein
MTTQQTMNAVYKHDPNIVFRNIAGEMILVPIRNNVSDMAKVFTLNETGARIWELFDGTRTLAQIHQQMAAEFDVNPEQAELDLLALVSGLLEIEALYKVTI